MTDGCLGSATGNAVGGETMFLLKSAHGAGRAGAVDAIRVDDIVEGNQSFLQLGDQFTP